MKETIVLLVSGEGDYGALTFHNNYDVNEVYQQMVEEGITEKTIQFEDDDGEEEINVSIYNFGEVDEAFISFFVEEFIDYDYSKFKDFYIIDQANEKTEEV